MTTPSAGRAAGVRPPMLPAMLVMLAMLAGLAGFGSACGARTGVTAQPGELVVFAAASLREIFTELARGFEAEHPGLRVVLNLAGSQELRTQIEQGARADVFASADVEQMAALERAGLVDRPVRFARNELVLVVPRDNPAGLRGFGDLPRAGRLILGAPEVPVGRYTDRMLSAAARQLGADFRRQVEARIVSRELNVRQVLAKVALGEVDAGIVYRTDALAAPDRVAAIAIPPELNVAADYPIARLRASGRGPLAAAWMALVKSAPAQKRLRAAGFLSPPASGPASAPALAPAPAGGRPR